MDEIEELAQFYKVFSDPTRLRLIKLLEKHQGALCVNALAKRLDISQSAVSQHLRVLRGIQLVDANRQGPMVHYSINKHKISEYTSLRQEVFGMDFF